VNSESLCAPEVQPEKEREREREIETRPVLKIKGHNFEIKLLNSSNPG